MASRLRGAIDCDVHPSVPSVRALLPYLDDYWRDMIEVRGIEGFMSRAYPPLVPASARPDWRGDQIQAAETVARMQADILDRWQLGGAILNCLYGVQQINDEGLEAAMCSAVNAWLAAEWLDRDPRLSASIVTPMQNPARAVEEIARWADDKRFVQVLMLVMGDMPLGKRTYWPIYAAAQRLGLTIGVHAGSAYHNPPTSIGWGSYHIEDYVAQATAFQTQLTSLIVEGVFARHPNLKMVMLESGFTWLPAYLWRLHKFWRGIRMETPWVDRAPLEIVRSNIRFSLQPVDAPPDPATLNRLFDHMQSDELLLFSTDYPHWQFDGDEVLPEGISADLVRKIMIDNPLKTYGRLEFAKEATP